MHALCVLSYLLCAPVHGRGFISGAHNVMMQSTIQAVAMSVHIFMSNTLNP